MKLILPFTPEYFRWLRNEAPEGGVETYPEIGENYESSVRGIYVIGDLTGLPLLKYAVDSGTKCVSLLPRSVAEKTDGEIYDLIIVGAGPAGVSAGIEAKKRGMKFLILEGNQAFHTVSSYPKGKPIFAEPSDLQISSPLQIRNGTKESLIEDLRLRLTEENLPLRENVLVSEILPSSFPKSRFAVRTQEGETFECLHLILAIGKSGDSRRLKVKGEDLPNVFHRLIDPADFQGQKVLVVGGGDSAIEASLALEESAESVTLSYRSAELSRPKEENKRRFLDLTSKGKILFFPETSVSEIRTGNVFLRSTAKEKSLSVDSTLVLIGSEPPTSFLKRIGVALQNFRSKRAWTGFFASLSFAVAVYFGKSAFYGIDWYSWAASAGLFGFGVFGILWYSMRDRSPIGLDWSLFRTFYLSTAALYFCSTYVLAKYFGTFLFGKAPGFHYTFLYSLTIVVFGIRRMKVRPTKYIRRQTWTLILVQVFPLFLLPEIILPFLGSRGFLGAPDGFLLTQVFPGGAYWKAYGLVLAWPLNMGVLYDGGITAFWLLYGIALTFLLIPYLVIRFGKGAYCGWICSCGGLAETLGDESRTKMSHGFWAYRLEHSGQWILLAAGILTAAKLLGSYSAYFQFLAQTADPIKKLYDVFVDIGLAGVLGLGAYFFLSGRVWCRMFCPLAALMHVYARFSRFRIFAEKKKCISCNVCTKVCHQGIDVMNYANRGRPMDSVQCVRCSACVTYCPTGVLSFGEIRNGKEVRETLKATL
ncbi:4Fe-4S binding protein [Leptospira fluminis]|uniref:4Fe-4S binding protein n=1 Tax=Leptospira fluminis TaxID=2484979 RepID=A0A4R9GLD7_9LEPT|nr:NAD(P)-binding domain-containing protein [Leptospira fluminis]TGK15556.1 4Fe-4S binding protein [Leptospira fluminis]